MNVRIYVYFCCICCTYCCIYCICCICYCICCAPCDKDLKAEIEHKREVQRMKTRKVKLATTTKNIQGQMRRSTVTIFGSGSLLFCGLRIR